MIVTLEVTNKDGEKEIGRVLDTAKQGNPEPPVQVLIKAAVNAALADVIDWHGRTLTVTVE